ncbi:transposase [Candidatus Marsarchaeota archaeon]|nr:transposase [Candidatus Marsarchaeota archaeon]
MDEAIFSLTPYFTRGWYKIGSKPARKYIWNPYQKTCGFAAIGLKKNYTKLSRTINANTYLSFLKRMKKHHKKLCVIGDNAPWHGPEGVQRSSKIVRQYIKDNDIVFLQIPPYSPELDPVEIYWRNVKKWVGTKPYASLPELKTILRSAFRRHSLMVDVSDY